MLEFLFPMDLELALQHRAQVEEFRRKHRTSLLTLVFTDIVGSTALRQGLGEREAASLVPGRLRKLD